MSHGRHNLELRLRQQAPGLATRALQADDRRPRRYFFVRCIITSILLRVGRDGETFGSAGFL